MTCNCNYRAKRSPEEIISKVRKGTVKFCDVCDPCNECVTNVKICAFVVPTLEEGRYFKNSFIFVQEDDSVYFITDDRSEIPFGSRPKFIDDFDPNDSAVHYKSTVVYDVKNGAGYVYDPEGNRVSIAMTAAPFSSLTAGEGMIVTADGGDYTVAIDPTVVARKDDLTAVTLLVTNHTSQINNLTDGLAEVAGDVETIEDTVDHLNDEIGDANGIAVEAKENAAAAQQTANDAMSTANAKQDQLTAGENISIVNNVISAAVPAYGKATMSQNGLMSAEDRKVMKNSGVYVPAANATTSATTVTINYTKSASDDDGTSYTVSNEVTTIPAATAQVAGVMSAADKSKLDGIAVGAEVNQNAFSNVKVGPTTVAADGETDTLTLTAGENVTLTPDVVSDTITIAATDTTYSNATTSEAGLMSAADKSKLNGIASGAEVNVQSDWNQTTATADDYIKNKPTVAQFTLQTTDPGTGGTLEANHFIVVYEA